MTGRPSTKPWHPRKCTRNAVASDSRACKKLRRLALLQTALYTSAMTRCTVCRCSDTLRRDGRSNGAAEGFVVGGREAESWVQKFQSLDCAMNFPQFCEAIIRLAVLHVPRKPWDGRAPQDVSPHATRRCFAIQQPATRVLFGSQRVVFGPPQKTLLLASLGPSLTDCVCVCVQLKSRIEFFLTKNRKCTSFLLVVVLNFCLALAPAGFRPLRPRLRRLIDLSLTDCRLRLTVYPAALAEGGQPYMLARAKANIAKGGGPAAAAKDLTDLSKAVRRAQKASAAPVHTGPAVTVAK